jgi:ABC-type multidrug transport system permease subunit
MTRIAGLMLRLGDRFEDAGELLFPPLIQYGVEEPESGEEEEEATAFNLFAIILPGFVGLFMFFLADSVVRDIYREELAHTLQRYRFFQGSLVPFMASKGFVSILVVMISMYFTIACGAVLFQIQLENVLTLALFVLVYSFFVTGFVLFLTAMAGTEKRADTLNPILIFTIAFLGGNMVPAQNLPSVITENISYLLPNFWFIRGMQHLQFGWYDVTIFGYSMLLLALGVFFFYLGSRILHGKLEGRKF